MSKTDERKNTIAESSVIYNRQIIDLAVAILYVYRRKAVWT